ncbi:hypothetical protein JTB14_031977 [Gonioctena quinquepunctata]|nr:hypothetical protein JTB14_031977 [Gonioctena quinquepunctata]
MEWNLDDSKQAEVALNYLFSSPKNEENSEAGTLAEVVPDPQACDNTEHNLPPDIPNNSEIGKVAEVPVKESMRVEGTADEDDNLEWLEDSEYFHFLRTNPIFSIYQLV